MSSRASLVQFGPFRLDLGRGELLRDGRRVPLQPRPLAVLRYLAARPGQLVSGDELLREVWVGVAVTRAVLKVAVRAIREALGDEVASPRYLETVGREGYRFLGAPIAPVSSQRGGAREPARPPLVARERELEQLRRAFRESHGGQRRVMLLAGEAGIGKTTLLDHLLDEVEAQGGVCVARGQCLEGYGPGEPYLPVLEALGRLARSGRAATLEAALRRHAPSWTGRLAGFGESEEPAGPGRAATPERMLRELADALDVATGEQPLVLALEDLHWSDPATLDLVACLARRREPARLLVVGSYRPSDAIVDGHPLRDAKRELVAKGLCEELPLDLLGAGDVAEYLRRRLGASQDLVALASALHARTAGNPLFLTCAVDDLVAHGVVQREPDGWHLAGSAADASESIPAAVQQLIEQQADRLAVDDLAMLEAASVAGVAFDVASLAAAQGRDAEELEERCELLAAQGRFIESAGVSEWPDGTLCGRYRFRHPLRARVLYDRLSTPRRVRLHRAIAECEEAAHGVHASERAAELASHFERGREYARAVEYREIAGRSAVHNNAPREGALHFEQGLHLLAQLTAGPARDATELALRVALAAPRMAMSGYAAASVGANYQRARVLCGVLGDATELLPVLRGLASHHQVRGDLALALTLGEELLERASGACEALGAGACVAQVQAHYGHGVTLFHAGQPLRAREHLERCLDLYRPEQHAEHARRYGGYDPGVAARLWLAWTLLVLGQLERGRVSAREALALAEQLGHPLTLAFARYGVAITHQTLGEWDDALRCAEQSIALAEAEGFAYELALATILRGWALTLRGQAAEGIVELRLGLARYTATGARLASAYRMLLAAAEAITGRLGEALVLAREALDATQGRERELEAVEVRCGAARILLGAAATKPEAERAGLAGEAEALLLSAVALAREQQAPLLELLAATGLARLWAAGGRRAAARELLAPLLPRFAGEHEIRDLRQAARLLAQLA